MTTMIRRFEVYVASFLGPWWVRDVERGYRQVAGPYAFKELAETEADRLNRLEDA